MADDTTNKTCAGCFDPTKHVQYTVTVITNKWITPWHKSAGEAWYCCGGQCLDLVVSRALLDAYDHRVSVAYTQKDD